MEATERVQRLLAKRDRVERVPTSAVVSLLRDVGYPVFEPWVAFHDRFAGYVEPLGAGDIAVLGLAQVAPYCNWMKELAVDVSYYEAEDGEEELYDIACADVHPSFGYRLDQKGQFFGASGRRPAADSYERRLEQMALYHEAKSADGWDPILREVPAAKRERLLVAVAGAIDERASDPYSIWYSTPDWLVVQDTNSGRCRVCGKKAAIAGWL